MHYYATCVYGYAKSKISEYHAIARCAARFASEIERQTDKTYFWTCRVEGDMTTAYDIEMYVPKDVPTSHHRQWDVHYDEDRTLAMEEIY